MGNEGVSINGSRGGPGYTHDNILSWSMPGTPSMKFPQLVLFYVRNATSEGAAQSKKKSVIYFSSLIFVGSRPWDVCLCLFPFLPEGEGT